MLRRSHACGAWILLALAEWALPPRAEAFDTWIDLRDSGVVRQVRDYSCGLAALATLLARDGLSGVSEERLLAALLARRGAGARAEIEDRGVSFADLAALAQDHGRRSLGLALTPESLRALRHPAIVVLHVDGRAHFSVLRAMTADGSALLADPSWGNRRLGAWQFAKLFAGEEGGTGRVLLVEVLPSGPAAGRHGAPPETVPAKVPVRVAPGLLGVRAPG